MKKTYLSNNGEVINLDTGEILTESKGQHGDSNFHKVWMNRMYDIIYDIGNNKTKLLFFLIRKADGENKVCMTYRQMAKESGISLDAVRMAMDKLFANGFIRKINNGNYIINPNIVFKGYPIPRQIAMGKFGNAKVITRGDNENE